MYPLPSSLPSSLPLLSPHRNPCLATPAAISLPSSLSDPYLTHSTSPPPNLTNGPPPMLRLRKQRLHQQHHLVRLKLQCQLALTPQILYIRQRTDQDLGEILELEPAGCVDVHERWARKCLRWRLLFRHEQIRQFTDVIAQTPQHLTLFLADIRQVFNLYAQLPRNGGYQTAQTLQQRAPAKDGRPQLRNITHAVTRHADCIFAVFAEGRLGAGGEARCRVEEVADDCALGVEFAGVSTRAEGRKGGDRGGKREAGGGPSGLRQRGGCG